MEPLNKSERVKTFFIFLVFFLLTVGLILVAAFIDVKVPAKEIEVLKAENSKLSRELEFQKRFSKKIYEVKSLLDTINQANSNALYLEQVASSKLAAMKESIPPADSLREKAMYDYVIQILLSLQENKRNLRDSRESKTLVSEYRQD
ncbi:MAG TPA: type VI secretion system TssO, partial [Cytophagaceae bacterium]